MDHEGAAAHVDRSAVREAIDVEVISAVVGPDFAADGENRAGALEIAALARFEDARFDDGWTGVKVGAFQANFRIAVEREAAGTAHHTIERGYVAAGGNRHLPAQIQLAGVHAIAAVSEDVDRALIRHQQRIIGANVKAADLQRAENRRRGYIRCGISDVLCRAQR